MNNDGSIEMPKPTLGNQDAANLPAGNTTKLVQIDMGQGVVQKFRNILDSMGGEEKESG